MECYIINHGDNEMESYQSSLNGSDDNFNFNDDYDDAQTSLRWSFSYFVFYSNFYMFGKFECVFGQDEFLSTI